MQRDTDATKFRDGEQLRRESDAALRRGLDTVAGAKNASGGIATLEKAAREFTIDDAGARQGGEKQ